MAHMTIYITRHGETSWNAQDRICGWADIPLTENGLAQAASLAERVKDKGITRIIVSPFLRARQTAELANTHIQVPVEMDARLREQCFGTFEGTSRKTREYDAAKHNLTCRFPGGESILDLSSRVYNFLDELPSRYPKDTLLLVCHGVVSRVIHTYFTDLPLEHFFDYKLDNCGLARYDYEDKPKISFDPSGPLLP
jgi:probable phosphoglycerate mutase